MFMFNYSKRLTDSKSKHDTSKIFSAHMTNFWKFSTFQSFCVTSIASFDYGQLLDWIRILWQLYCCNQILRWIRRHVYICWRIIPLTGSIHAVLSEINETYGLQSNHMDPVSISDTTPYLEISQIIKSPRSSVKIVRIALKSDRHIGSNFQGDRTILNTNLASLRLRDFVFF